MSKHLSKPNTNSCHFCDKIYSANLEDIFAAGKLFKIDETMIGVSHFHTVVACPACIRRRVANLKMKMDEMLCEVSQLETGKRIERWYPPKKVPHKKCPEHGGYDFDEEDGYCYECGFHYCDEIEDPRQIKIRERREKRDAKNA
jgi:hypothetical protein